MSETRILSYDALSRFESGMPLDETDRDGLGKSALLFEAMAAYKPANFAPRYGAGKTYYALGRYEEAAQSLRQALANARLGTSHDLDMGIAEAHRTLSETYTAQDKLEEGLQEADASLAIVETPSALAARAAALIQLQRVDEADAALRKALQMDREHPRSLTLRKLIELAR